MIMVNFSDLALEIEGADIESMMRREKIGRVEIIRTDITDENIAHRCNRRRGKYVSVDNACEIDEGELAEVVRSVISDLVGQSERVLIVGFGNDRYASDALGQKVIDSLKVGEYERMTVGAVAPLVKSITGIDSRRIVEAIVAGFKPDVVIAVDTLATSSVSRLVNSVQMTDAGINPGGGVDNPQGYITKENLGVKVIAIGVPLVIGVTRLGGRKSDYVDYVTPKDVDRFVEKYASIIAKGINKALIRI